jgi:hypothetical protein
VKKSIWKDDDLPIDYAGQEPEYDEGMSFFKGLGVALVIVCLMAVFYFLGRWAA